MPVIPGFVDYDGYTRQDALNSVGAGWHSLIEPIFDYIDSNPTLDIKVTQVKEKFGTLRIYLSSSQGVIRDMVAEAESVSGSICEVCGHLGQTTRSSYINTMCARHDPSILISNTVDEADWLAQPPFTYEEVDINDEMREAIIKSEDYNQWRSILRSPSTSPALLRLAWARTESIPPHHRRQFQAYIAIHPSLPPDLLLDISRVLDTSVLSALARRSDLPPNILDYLLATDNVSICSILAPKLPLDKAVSLSAHPSRLVRATLLGRPDLSSEWVGVLAKDNAQEVIDLALRHPNCPESVLRQTFLKSPGSALDIAINPKAPIDLLMECLMSIPYSEKLSPVLIILVWSRLVSAPKPLPKPFMSWLILHPDKEIRVKGSSLAVPSTSRSLSPHA